MVAATLAMPMKTETRSGGPPADDSSRLWLERLAPSSPEREAAVVELHALLLSAARFEVNRRRGELPHLRGDDHEDLAQQSADNALMAVLRKLDDYRGESRFTTWAYKFALLEAAVTVRHRAWQGREIPLAEEGWAVLADVAAPLQRQAEDEELFGALREEIARLTAHRREVLVAVTLNDVPIDVLAERLGSTRGALYKTLHDARRNLRAALRERGLQPGPRKEEA